MIAATNNGIATADPLLALGARLLCATDREDYAELVFWVRSLPRDDEVVKLARFLGYITMLSRELPEVLITEAAKLHQLAQTSASYHAALEQRLQNLPAEIASGVNLTDFAPVMSESFRQQIAATGLEDTGEVLEDCVAGLQKLSSDLGSAVKPLVAQYAGIGTAVAADLAKLTATSDRLREHNAQLAAHVEEERSYRRVVLYASILLVGFLLGLTYEKASTTDPLGALQNQAAEIQQKLVNPVPAPTPGPQFQLRKRGSK